MRRKYSHSASAGGRRFLPTASLLSRRDGASADPRKRPVRFPGKEEWRNIVEEETVSESNRPLAGSRLNDWLLVLEARAYPHRFTQKEGGTRIEVPAGVSGEALREIREFEAEADPAPVYIPPKRQLWPVLSVLFLLFVWHGLRNGWFVFALPAPPFPSASGWPAAFGLDTYRVVKVGEWWRTVTALFVHKDNAHLASNLCFGLLFMGFFCQRAGNGLALLGVLAAGALGNAGNALFRDVPTVSIGFSTAVFAAVGLLGAFSCLDFLLRSGNRNSGFFPLARSVLLPLAAGVALLAFLGGASSEGTDFAAHAWGFGSGAFIGGMVYPLERGLRASTEKRQRLVQAALGAVGLLIIIFCWLAGLPDI